MIGSVEKYLLDKIEKENTLHITLIDPENITSKQASIVAKTSSRSGTSAIMIGGSTSISKNHLNSIVKSIKQTVELPLILFPNDITGISKSADAIWFMSLLNSIDPYFLMGAQILGAPIIKKLDLEPISLGYIIVGDGGTAGIVGNAPPIPYSKSELVIAHALAGQYLGMRFIYLEGGSGTKIPVPPKIIRAVKNVLDIPLIVGGGIRTKEQAISAASAGADIIVTGNLIESNDVTQKTVEIIKGIRNV